MVRHPFAYAFLAVLAFAILMAAGRAEASADVILEGYKVNGGSFTPVSDGDTIPLGAQLEIRVFVDLYSCDPVTLNWGDGTVQTATYGGSFAEAWYHTYGAAGSYTIQATEPCGGTGKIKTINVGGAGGGFAIFNPSGDYFMPSFLGVILGLATLGQALGGAQLPRANPAAAPGPGSQAAPWNRKRLQPGIPASMISHLVSYRDIPIGAERLPEPRIQMVAGQPTDVFQQVACDECHGKLGWVAGGWFCLDPACPHNQHGPAEPFKRIVRGL